MGERERTVKCLLAEVLALVAFHRGAEHCTRAVGSGVGAAVAGSHVAVPSDWVERPRFLPVAGIDRADVSWLEV